MRPHGGAKPIPDRAAVVGIGVGDNHHDSPVDAADEVVGAKRFSDHLDRGAAQRFAGVELAGIIQPAGRVDLGDDDGDGSVPPSTGLGHGRLGSGVQRSGVCEETRHFVTTQ
jgi:hypothetical protein